MCRRDVARLPAFLADLRPAARAAPLPVSLAKPVPPCVTREVLERKGLTPVKPTRALAARGQPAAVRAFLGPRYDNKAWMNSGNCGKLFGTKLRAVALVLGVSSPASHSAAADCGRFGGAKASPEAAAPPARQDGPRQHQRFLHAVVLWPGSA